MSFFTAAPIAETVKKEVMDALTYFDLTSEEFLAQRFAMGKDFHVHVHICIRSDLGATVIFCVFLDTIINKCLIMYIV